jgi:uncharacterized protein (DUF302 family)
MRFYILAAVVTSLLSLPPAHAGDVLLTTKSSHSVMVTIDRLEAAARAKGIVVVARVDHPAAAAKAGMELRPTQLLVFGNPTLGTPLLQSNPHIGLDLPLKALAWQDAAGAVWLGYTAPADLVARYQIGDRAEVVQKMTGVLDALTTQATRP